MELVGRGIRDAGLSERGALFFCGDIEYLYRSGGTRAFSGGGYRSGEAAGCYV